MSDTLRVRAHAKINLFLRILAREGKYGVVQVRRGVMPDAYAHFTLPQIGRAHV